MHRGHFYEKDAPGYTPDWVRTHPVPRRAGGKDIRYILIDDLPTLVWCANLANLELHPFLHWVQRIDRPGAVVFDLDPGEGMGVLDCARVVFLLKDVLDGLALRSFAKVSGSKGLQVYVPLNRAAAYDATRTFSRTLAGALASTYPDLVVTEMRKSLRELRRAVEKGDELPLYFSPGAALERLARTGDLFAEVLTVKQKAAAARGVKAARPAPRRRAGKERCGGWLFRFARLTRYHSCP